MEKRYNRIKAERVFDVFSIVYLGHSFSSRITETRKVFDFWQMYYSKKGTLKVISDDNIIQIPEHHAVFLSPKGDRRTVMKSDTADSECEFYFASFECQSQAMSAFSDTIIPLYGREPKMIEEFCGEGAKILRPIKLGDSLQGLCEKDDCPAVVLQYIKNLLEQILIKIYCRLNSIDSLSDEAEKTNRTVFEKKALLDAEEYMKKNVHKHLTIKEVADAIGVNETTLRLTYKKLTGTSLIKAFRKMKLFEAQRLINNTDLNFTEIAERLGFSSLYHFSRFFKEQEGMTLSEYSRFSEKE